MVKLSPLCWLAALRGAGGALGCFRFRHIWLLFVFCRCFRTGCQSSARGGGGSASFALALRSLSRLRVFLFEARLSGYCVREGGGVKGVNPGFLVLAFSTGTLKGSGVPARPVQGGGFCASMLALVCSTPACPWALGRRAFSCGPPLLRFGVLLSSQQESPRR